MRHYKLVIIGAGTAGLAAFSDARRHTDSVLLINHGPYGTTCARTGCMPSKALLGVAHAFHQREFLGSAGIRQTDGLSVDMPAVMQHVRKLRDQFTAGAVRASQPGEHSIAGKPRFLDAHRLEVNGEILHTDATIIATGSSPVVPQAWQALGSKVVTSEDFFEVVDPGRRIAVIGLGAIGAELGQGLAHLGLDVRGFSRGELLGGLTDPDISAALAASLRQTMTLALGVSVSLEDAGDRVRVMANGQGFDADLVLAAMGRRPNLQDLGLENLGLSLDERGMPPLDPQTLRVANLPVFMAGDVSGLRPLMHEAADEGRLAAYHALHPDAECLTRRSPLAIVFTQPEAARVGLGWRDLAGEQFVTGSADFSKQARARMTGANAGLLHVYVHAHSRKLLGAEMAVPESEHLAHLLAWTIQQGLRVDEVLQMPFYHPVVEEGLRSALQSASKQLGSRPTAPDLPRCQP